MKKIIVVFLLSVLSIYASSIERDVVKNGAREAREVRKDSTRQTREVREARKDAHAQTRHERWTEPRTDKKSKKSTNILNLKETIN
ncbi:MAG: hypothetical protein PF437_08960 [Sulfurimonas sp.]|jgi:hypothetical protein|nr:hypothetical protein [Sulfurimonas sp.]